MKIFRYQDKNFDLDLFGTYGLEYRTTRAILRVKKNNRYFKIDSNPGRNTINEATGRQPELLENTGHVIRINNNEYDLHLLDLYEIPYKIVGDKLKVARANNEQDKKKWFNIESARALRVLKAYTDGNPRYIQIPRNSITASRVNPEPIPERLTRTIRYTITPRQSVIRHRAIVPSEPILTHAFESEYPFYELKKGIKGREYYINHADISSYDIQDLRRFITPRLEHARRTVPGGSDVHIRFTMENKNMFTSKSFNSFLINDEAQFWRAIQQFNDLHTVNTPDYTYNINKITIKIINENAGGCTKNNTKNKIGQTVHSTRKASNNNCFLVSVLDLLNIETERLSRAKGNQIRAEFNIPQDDLISITQAIEIFKTYRKDPLQNIAITDNETLQTTTTGDENIIRTLALKDSHYSIVELAPKKRCLKCNMEYSNKHSEKNCLTRTQFYKAQVLKTGARFLLCKDKAEPTNTEDQVLHYDLETYQNKTIANGTAIHTPYIVGYHEGDEFKYLAGDDCIVKFVDYILKKGEDMRDEDEDRKLKRTLYINAYNGANFDHYFIFQEFIRRNLQPEKQIINNGAIISFKYKNITLFDVCKHLQGSLADNLRAFKCEIQKGELNHDLATRWEDTTEEVKAACIKYLKSDVMGLKEIYHKANEEVYNEYKANLTSYISTSSITFNMWKKSINGKFSVELPSLTQEIAFRQAVRGGRTYKSKHAFTSAQYEKFKSGEVEFDKIDDYLIDADVVSLYPSAMSQYPYPVGECIELGPDDNTMKGKIGIYYITFETNKNLMHSVGGRRENGALKWDLKDETEGAWYCSVDIEDMIASGYKVNILKGFYWEETAYIFKEYIEQLFKKKDDEAAAGRKGSVSYLLCKLWMNGLYGKNIQRPIYNDTRMIKNNSEYWKFWGTHIINDITNITNAEGETVWFVSGTPREESKKEKCITKPTQLGAFILAYSRRIMLNYMKEANPHFDSTDKEKQTANDFYYTDTDSLQMHARNAKLMQNLGKQSLGGITDDLGPSCKILRGIWIAPKLYMLEYIKKGSPTLHYHLRGKGLNKNTLTPEQFEKMNEGQALTNTRAFQMKKINIKKNSKQQDIPAFSIIHYSAEDNKQRLTRTVNTTAWAGRNFNGNDSTPWTL